MTRRHPVVTALVVVAVLGGTVAAFAAWRDDGSGDGAAPVPVVAAGPGACAEPAAVLRDVTPVDVPPAPVSVAGAREIDTGGYVVTDLASGGGQVWAAVTDPTANPTEPVALAARIDETAGAITSITTVAEGCSLSALAVGEGGVWVATCDELAAAGTAEGGQVARIDPVTGAVVGRSPLPTRCIGELTLTPGAVTAADFPTSGEPQRLFRVDAATGAVAQTQDLAGDVLGGIAGTDAGVWTEEVGPDGQDEAVLSDPVTGEQETAVPEDDAVLIGASADSVWFERQEPATIVQRDADTGEVRSETPVADVQSAAAGPSGAWFQQASVDSLSITVGRIDPATGAVAETFTFTGVGPDRTGLPFLGTLAVDETGAWLIYQGRLFRFAVTAAPPPETTAPSTSAPASTAPTTTAAPPSSTTTTAPTEPPTTTAG